MSAPSAKIHSITRETTSHSSQRITVSTMVQNTGPGGAALSPSTSVWSDEGVRHSITLKGRANRVPSSSRRTTGKSARTAHVRLVHPSAWKVSSKRRICGLPATSTRGLGSETPAAASREPSPPARIRPCTLGEDPFDLGEARDARRGTGPRRLRPLGRGKPARAHAKPGGRGAVHREFLPPHPRADRRRARPPPQRPPDDT